MKRKELVAAGALAIATIAAYAGSVTVPLLFDDLSALKRNGTITHLWPLTQALTPPNADVTGGRPLLNLSYALNYAFGRLAVFGYHAVNLSIHVLAALTLFAIVRSTLRGPGINERFRAAATPLALAVSAIWSLHPLQTESVTYLSQRAESMMGLFYLLSVYCFIRYADGRKVAESVRISLPDRGQASESLRIPPHSILWAGLSFLCCLFGMLTKEVMVTAPVMVCLYDRAFVSGTFAAAWRRHWPLYLGLMATWIPLALLMSGLSHRGVGFGPALPWWAYGLMESRVVVKYLLLTVWPRPLVFDYGQFPIPRMAEVWPYLAILAGLLLATLAAVWRRPQMGFLAAWFFLILAPASSIVPVTGQPMAESRLYLSVAAVAAAIVLAGFGWKGKKIWPVAAALILALGLATAARNRIYRSDTALWSDTVAKIPGNPRAHFNLGVLLEDLPGRRDDALAEYQTAVRLKPDYADAHNNLGFLWSKLPDRQADAIAEYRVAIRLQPQLPEPHFNLGVAWAKRSGLRREALAQYREAIRLRPGYAEAHDKLGILLSRWPGHAEEAIAEFHRAVALQPDNAEAHNNLGAMLVKQPGHLGEAIREFQAAVNLGPTLAQARENLAWAQRRIAGP